MYGLCRWARSMRGALVDRLGVCVGSHVDGLGKCVCEPCRRAESRSVGCVESWKHVCGPCRWAGSVCGHVDKLAYCRVQNGQLQLRCEDMALGQEGPPTQGRVSWPRLQGHAVWSSRTMCVLICTYAYTCIAHVWMLYSAL